MQQDRGGRHTNVAVGNGLRVCPLICTGTFYEIQQCVWIRVISHLVLQSVYDDQPIVALPPARGTPLAVAKPAMYDGCCDEIVCAAAAAAIGDNFVIFFRLAAFVCCTPRVSTLAVFATMLRPIAPFSCELLDAELSS
jgi:hypothetical protein